MISVGVVLVVLIRGSSSITHTVSVRGRSARVGQKMAATNLLVAQPVPRYGLTLAPWWPTTINEHLLVGGAIDDGDVVVVVVVVDKVNKLS